MENHLWFRFLWRLQKFRMMMVMKMIQPFVRCVVEVTEKTGCCCVTAVMQGKKSGRLTLTL